LTTPVQRDSIRPLRMIDSAEQFAGSTQRRTRWALALSVLVAVLGGALVMFFGVGRWLFVEDDLEKTQAILVLSGRMPLRAIEAARLYNGGYASEVWLTRPSEPAASLQTMHITYLSEDFFNSRVLMHEGVPTTAIRVLEPPIANTVDELLAAAKELDRDGGSAVIIVTTKAHTRRVRTLWQKVSHGRRRAIVRAPENDPFQPRRWWRTSADALDVVREVLGLLNAWAGLPLRPST
jgi:uncharacterized SAM-binding protein YcdF (DUF218 family)